MRVGALRDLYAWVLQVPEPDLAMTFQEVSALSSCSEPPAPATRGCHPPNHHRPAVPLAPLGLTVLSSPHRSWWT